MTNLHPATFAGFLLAAIVLVAAAAAPLFAVAAQVVA